MSAEATRWAWAVAECYDNEALPGMTRCVLAILADFCKPGMSVCWPSRKRIALRAGISDRQVSRHLDHLRAMGLITGDRRGRSNGSDTSKTYRLAFTPGYSDPLANMSPVSRLDMSPVSTPEPVTRTGSSEVLRTSSGSASGSRVPTRRQAQAAQQADWDDLDPSAAVADVLEDPAPPEDAGAPRTASDLAKRFRHSLDLPFVSGSHKALMVNLKAWLRDGLTASEVAAMIDAYAASDRKATGVLPYQDFVNRRAEWLAAAQKRTARDAMEANRDNPDYWR